MEFLWIALGIWAFGVLAFVIAMIREAPKHNANLGVVNYLVAVFWPVWVLWYIGFVINDAWSK